MLFAIFTPFYRSTRHTRAVSWLLVLLLVWGGGMIRNLILDTKFNIFRQIITKRVFYLSYVFCAHAQTCIHITHTRHKKYLCCMRFIMHIECSMACDNCRNVDLTIPTNTLISALTVPSTTHTMCQVWILCNGKSKDGKKWEKLKWKLPHFTSAQRQRQEKRKKQTTTTSAESTTNGEKSSLRFFVWFAESERMEMLC